MTSNTDVLSDDEEAYCSLLKAEIISEDGKTVDFGQELKNLSRAFRSLPINDHHVMDVLMNPQVNADLVTHICLSHCSGITNDTLIQISNVCPQLEELTVDGCDMITDDGIVAIAKKCGQQLKILAYSACNECTDAALKSIVNNCNQLEELWAEDCGISTIPENIGYNLTKLKLLDLLNNKITKIPPSLTLLNDTVKYGNFHISGNPLQEPPIEIADQGFEAIKRYFIRELGMGLSHKSTIGGTDDSPTLDPDRLGYFIYAEALSNMVQKVESPHNSICGALYGPWGTGKTFLHKLMQQVQDKQTKEALEKIFRELEERDAKIFERSMRHSLQSLCDLAMLACNCCGSSSSTTLPHQVESVAALIAVPVLWPVWISVLIVCYPVSFFIEATGCCTKEPQRDRGYDPVQQSDKDASAMENGQDSCLAGKRISWSKVWDILTGVTSLHAQKVFLRRTCIEKIKFLFLNCMRPLMKSIDKLCTWDIQSFTCGREEFEVNNDTTKYINVSFNAWVYSGTELLWASLLEEMWTKVEAEFGEYSVRFHRASIRLSNESESDTLETRQSKRMAAILVLKVKGYASLFLALLGMASIFFFHVTISDFGESLYQMIIAQVAISSPLLLYIGSFVTKVLPELQKSRGKQILQEVQSFDDHKRADFSKKTGFMGEVKTEVGYLFDFLRATHIRDEKHRVLRPVRLSIFVDDLDRCQPDTIMSVLEAVMLLLMVDAPITCWLAIDSRVVVASIEKHYGDKFSEEGLDGYKFLDKIVQIPFCIPDLDSTCKKNYMQKILVKNELDPLRVYARLKYLLHDAEFSEFRDLVDDNDSVFQKEPTKTKKEPTKTEATRALVPVLDKMFRKGIVDGKKIGAMIKGPGDVHKAVVQRLQSNDALGEQLEEEFLHFISIGIQNILEGHIQKLKKNPSDPSNILSPTNFLSPINPGELNFTNDGSVSKPDGDPVARSVGAIATSEVVDYRLGGYSELFQPMADKVEAEWFDNYAHHFVGEPRKIKRIINSYMVSRFVADRMMASRSDEVFREKLLKLIILFEQWPYRMAWLLVVVENLQQEKHILTNLQKEGHIVSKWNHKEKNQQDNAQETCDAQEVENQTKPNNNEEENTEGNRQEKNYKNASVGECPLTTIITKLSGSINYLDLPLLKVYHLLVQGLIHSPDQSHFQLQRDGDPQVFEMLLSDISTPSNLKMKDIGLPGEIGSENTLRPFAFNLQRHLIEKVQVYLDNCMLHLGTNTGDEMVGVYQKKEKFFNRKHPICNE